LDVDTNVSEKHNASIFRGELGCWEVDHLYGVRRRTRLGENWPTRVEERVEESGQIGSPLQGNREES